MSRYLILLPAPEAEWAALPESEHENGMRSHGQFHEDLTAGGHAMVTGGPLEPSTCAPPASGSQPGVSTSSSAEWPNEIERVKRDLR